MSSTPPKPPRPPAARAGHPRGAGPRAGHRSLPHTADLRVEAWGATREEAMAEAVRGLVESFADPTGARPRRTVTTELSGDGEGAEDGELLAALLDDVVYRLDTADEVPLDLRLTPVPGGLRVAYRMADATALPVVGAAPKAVTLHGLSLTRTREGWRCSVTLDV